MDCVVPHFLAELPFARDPDVPRLGRRVFDAVQLLQVGHNGRAEIRCSAKQYFEAAQFALPVGDEGWFEVVVVLGDNHEVHVAHLFRGESLRVFQDGSNGRCGRWVCD